MIASVKPTFWQEQIQLAMKTRKEKTMFKDDKYIELQHDFHSLITNSMHVSSSKLAPSIFFSDAWQSSEPT